MKAKIAIALLAAGAALTGCGPYIPDGATAIVVKNARSEYERADLRVPPEIASGSPLIPMRWYDTNSFLTTATLTPGEYSFRARNFDGQGVSHPIKIVAGENYYELDVAKPDTDNKENPASSADVAPPVVSGKIADTIAFRLPRNANLTAVFIGKEVTLRTARIHSGGAFTVDAPSEGKWRIEIVLAGETPLTYTHPLTTVSKAGLDLGTITLN